MEEPRLHPHLTEVAVGCTLPASIWTKLGSSDLTASTEEKKHRMNRKFGGGKLTAGTPSLAWSCVVVVASLLVGALIVHNIYKPNLTLPPVEDALSKQSEAKQSCFLNLVFKFLTGVRKGVLA